MISSKLTLRVYVSRDSIINLSRSNAHSNATRQFVSGFGAPSKVNDEASARLEVDRLIVVALTDVSFRGVFITQLLDAAAYPIYITAPMAALSAECSDKSKSCHVCATHEAWWSRQMETAFLWNIYAEHAIIKVNEKQRRRESERVVSPRCEFFANDLDDDGIVKQFQCRNGPLNKERTLTRANEDDHRES